MEPFQIGPLEKCILTYLLSVDFLNVPNSASGLSVQMSQLAKNAEESNEQDTKQMFS